jgi:long-subunit fatty acid transport protein
MSGLSTGDSTTPENNEYDTATGYGFGAGLLATVYDNNESFKVNFGIAYQSFVRFDFSVEPELFPAFDMPQQFNAGFTFYLLEEPPFA